MKNNCLCTECSPEARYCDDQIKHWKTSPPATENKLSFGSWLWNKYRKQYPCPLCVQDCTAAVRNEMHIRHDASTQEGIIGLLGGIRGMQNN